MTTRPTSPSQVVPRRLKLLLAAATIFPVVCWLVLLEPALLSRHLIRQQGAAHPCPKGSDMGEVAADVASPQLAPRWLLLSRSQAWSLGALSAHLQHGSVSEEGANAAAVEILRRGAPAVASGARSEEDSPAPDGADGSSSRTDTQPALQLPPSLVTPDDPLWRLIESTPIPELKEMLATWDATHHQQTVLEASGAGGGSGASSSSDAASRLRRIVTLSNVLWTLGVLGVVVSVLPTLAVVAGPPLLLLAREVHLRLRPFYPLAGYLVCSYGSVYSALRCSPAAAPFVALAAAGTALMIFTQDLDIYSMPLRCHSLRQPQDWNAWLPDLALLVSLHATASLVPLAIATRSPFLGFLATAALFSVLGFHVTPSGLCWCIGWNSGSAMAQTTVTSATISAAVLCLKLLAPALLLPPPPLPLPSSSSMGAHHTGAGAVANCVAAATGAVPGVAATGATAALLPWWHGALGVFMPGLMTFGAITLGLAGLIYSSCHYRPLYCFDNGVQRRRAYRRYVLINVAFAAGALCAMLCGAVLHLPVYFNTAITFIVLWLGEKVLEVILPLGLWPALLALSGMLCWAASALNSHPGWLAAMFAG